MSAGDAKVTAGARHQRWVLHADLDAFFASVETLDDPSLAGKPVIVGGLGNRGVVATANYEARKFGIHSALPMAIARRKCPSGVFRSPNMCRYQQVSRQVMEILRSVTPLVEPLSVDEALLDVSGSLRRLGSLEVIAASIREQVHGKCGITVSVGGGSSACIAKLASEAAKPDGFRIVSVPEQQTFMDSHTVRSLPGVGPKLSENLNRIGIRTVRDARLAADELLQRALGAHRVFGFRNLCIGIDDRVIEVHREAKSVGHELTFARDLTTAAEIEHTLRSILHEAVRRAREKEVTARTVQLKVRNAAFETITRSRTIAGNPMNPGSWWPVIEELWNNVPNAMGAIRLLGISFSQLERAEPELFSNAASPRVDTVIDAVRDRFGSTSIGPARFARDAGTSPDGRYGPTGNPR